MGIHRVTPSIVNWKDRCAGKIGGLGLYPHEASFYGPTLYDILRRIEE